MNTAKLNPLENQDDALPLKKKKQYKALLPLRTDQTVKDQFQFTPLSVLEPTKESKKKWESLGAYLDVVEKRRSENCEYLPGLKFSEFHAGLTENIVKYWSVEGDSIVDPFCGRATRAFVSSSLNRKYQGYEVSPLTHQRVEAHLLKHNLTAQVHLEDGCKLNQTADSSVDLVMTCPPYYTLEVYEEAPEQLSRLPDYASFLNKVDECAKNCFRVLRGGKFCAWVVADFRHKGKFLSFSSDCISSFKAAGFNHWDTIIIKNFSPFAALQMGKVASKRYTSKIHEFLLVFRKPE